MGKSQSLLRTWFSSFFLSELSFQNINLLIEFTGHIYQYIHLFYNILNKFLIVQFKILSSILLNQVSFRICILFNATKIVCSPKELFSDILVHIILIFSFICDNCQNQQLLELLSEKVKVADLNWGSLDNN